MAKGVKRAAIELWQAKVPLASGRKQLEMPERTLRMILQFAWQSPDSPISDRKKSANQQKVSLGTMVKIKLLLLRFPSLTAKELKTSLPELANVSIRMIEEKCQKEMGLPSRKLAQKPLLTKRMKDVRLAFDRHYQNWTVEDWKKLTFT
jgi:hypothetical protein